MSMQPSFSSGGDVNPFDWVARKLAKYPKKQEDELTPMDHAMAIHQAQYAAHQYGMEMESHKAGLEEQARQAEHGRRKEFLTSVLRHAKHETPIHLSMGDYSTQFVRKPKPEVPQAQQIKQTAKPKPTKTKPTKLAYNDPETGRIKYREA